MIDLRSWKIKNDLTYNEEVSRKLIHLFDSIIPLSLFFLSYSTVLYILIPVSIVFISIDFLRHHVKLIKDIYLYFFDRVTRNIEKKNNTFTGATYYLLGCLLTMLLFNEKSIIVASLLTMSVADSFAAIIGIKYGSTKIYNNKSLEGSFTFFIISFLILNIFIPSLTIYFCIIIALVVTLVELFSFHYVNDNITIPISCALLIKFLA